MANGRDCDDGNVGPVCVVVVPKSQRILPSRAAQRLMYLRLPEGRRVTSRGYHSIRFTSRLVLYSLFPPNGRHSLGSCPFAWSPCTQKLSCIGGRSASSSSIGAADPAALTDTETGNSKFPLLLRMAIRVCRSKRELNSIQQRTHTDTHKPS